MTCRCRRTGLLPAADRPRVVRRGATTVTWYTLVEELLPSLRRGDLGYCTARVATVLEAMPETPFHAVLDADFSNPPADVAARVDAFLADDSRHLRVHALYAETNGFDINTDLWFFNLFGYTHYGGHDDYDWLSDWDAGESPYVPLTGMEGLQAVYASNFGAGTFSDASDLCSLLVVLRFQSLIHRSAPLSRLLRVPLLTTSHDYDFIYEFSPQHRLPDA